jgi:hypothetical protein
MNIHAWFSAATALRVGSAVYRKPVGGGGAGGAGSGATVNVTRMSPDFEAKGPFPYDERYVGEVIRAEDGGCVAPTSRVDGITTQLMRSGAAMRRAAGRQTPTKLDARGSPDAGGSLDA